MLRKLMVITLIIATVLLPAFGAYGDTSLNDKLMDAAEYGDYEAVKKLLEAGASVNIQGDTALMYAVQNRHPTEGLKIVNALINAGADINVRDVRGRTALIYATWCESPQALEITNALIKAGADLNIKDDEGMTALMCALWHDNLELAQTLIDAGAYVNTKSKHGGETALIILVSRRFLNDEDDKVSEIAEALIKAGANVNVKDNDGWSAVMYAEFWEANKTISVLRKAGALGKLTPAQRENYRIYLHGN